MRTLIKDASLDSDTVSVFAAHFNHKHSHRILLGARSFFGYIPVQNAQPNRVHYSVAALQYMNLVDKLVTQVSVHTTHSFHAYTLRT